MRKNYTPQELCNEVYQACFNAGQPPTRKEICEMIGRKKSPHIIDMIENLVAGGYLEKTQVERGKWGGTWVYWATKTIPVEAACPGA